MSLAYQWTGEILDVGGLDRVRPSGRYRLRDGRSFAVATRADYERALRESGMLHSDEPLAGRPDLAAAVQAHWHAAGHNACKFAVFLSARRGEYGWETCVLADRETQVLDAEALSTVVRPRLEAPEVEVVSVLMPGVTTARQLTELVWRLGGMEHWRLRDRGAEEDEELGRVVRVGLDADVGLDQWSEVLGFGPFAPFAYTRRAPFCELAIRAKPWRRPRRNQRAYMADIQVDVDTPTFGEWWHRTELARAERLGPEHDARGKARVTVVIPEAEWRRHGG